MKHDGKILLVLGATPYSINVVKTAKKMGAYVIIVDPVPNSAAKCYADKSYDVDTTDINTLYDIAEKEKINGVFTGYSDVNLFSCCKLCDRFGLPFYATESQILKTTDKLLFKEMCRKYDVGTVPQYSESELATVSYPIIIKPADSYGSKGITVCYHFEDTISAVIKARKYSKTNQIIIEKYMGGLADVNIDYVMQDGEIILTAVGDRYVNTEQKGLSPLTAAVVYPSVYLDKYIETLDKKVKRMFYEEGMHNGTVFIQSFFDGDQFYFFEMGYRTGGGQSSILISKMCGIDYVEELINYALTGRMDDRCISQMANPAFEKKACCVVPILCRGFVGKIKGLDTISAMPECVNITQFYHVGDEIKHTSIGNLGQSFARLHFVANSWQSLKEIVEYSSVALRGESLDGQNMILRGGFDGSKLPK
jgi:carbamoylphosphate synthase large subunit